MRKLIRQLLNFDTWIVIYRQGPGNIEQSQEQAMTWAMKNPDAIGICKTRAPFRRTIYK